MTDAESFKYLDAYLDKLERRASESKVELGLARVEAVLGRLFPSQALAQSHVITAAGTNGKGSTLAFAESICLASNRSVVVYGSPHIEHFTERLRINGHHAKPDQWLSALQAVEAVMGDVALTYFEHVTLAAFLIIDQIKPEVALLEVGLGGRLDAVNVIDPEVAVVTNIGLDHQDYLGPTRVHIGREKLGIARARRPLILAERDFPEPLEDVLSASGAIVHRVGEAFDWQLEPEAGPDPGAWSLSAKTQTGVVRRMLPSPGLIGAHQLGNAASAIMALVAVYGPSLLKEVAVVEGIANAKLPGRFECVSEAPEVILDVAHNQESCQALAETLHQRPVSGRTLALFGAFKDKPVEAMATALIGCFDHWYVAGLAGVRGQTGSEVAKRLGQGGITEPIDAVKSTSEALEKALADAKARDRVVVFGSFHVLAEVRSRWASKEKSGHG